MTVSIEVLCAMYVAGSETSVDAKVCRYRRMYATGGISDLGVPKRSILPTRYYEEFKTASQFLTGSM